MSKTGRAPFWRRLKLYWSMVRYGNAHNQDFAREHVLFFSSMRDHLASRGKKLEELRVIDVGCGKMMWLTLLLHSAGARVTGIDTEWTGAEIALKKYWGILRSNGMERALRTMVWDSLYARPYYRALAKESPFTLRFDECDARCMSVTDLEFESESIDLVVSHEVFEHLPDIEGAAVALKRVLKPDGLTYIYVHNFASISGGHHIAWKYPDSEPSSTVPPWDHLRENRFPDIPSWINRQREHTYREAFEKHFEILDWIPTIRESEALLTPTIQDELSEYSEQELLTKGFIIVARPRKGNKKNQPQRGGGSSNP